MQRTKLLVRDDVGDQRRGDAALRHRRRHGGARRDASRKGPPRRLEKAQAEPPFSETEPDNARSHQLGAFHQPPGNLRSLPPDGWWRTQSLSNPSPRRNSLLTGKRTGNFAISGASRIRRPPSPMISGAFSQIPYATEQGISAKEQGISCGQSGNFRPPRKRPFLAHLFRCLRNTICSRPRFADGENEMADEHRAWKRQGEAFWRAHHEAWKRSDLNQRQYCEAHGLPLKAFENWRAEVQSRTAAARRKLLYRRRGLSPPLSPPVSP